MCHRSEAAERSIKNLSTFYDVGDLVKAVVLKVTRFAMSRNVVLA